MSFIKKLAQHIIIQTIRDLRDPYAEDYASAKAYIHSDRFARDLISAGYPRELAKSLNMEELSAIQQRVACRDILHVLPH